jgi:hypothetical protein
VLGQPDPCVVVAGDGVAASALACRLLEEGFGVVLLAGRRRPDVMAPPTVEALAEATVRLFGLVGLGPTLEAAGGVPVEGFENRYGPHRLLDGVWLHVDRSRRARACRTEARRRGATLVPAGDVPEPVGFARVDATGRAARWSRPVSRSGSGVARLYAGPGRSPRPGRIVRTQRGWAYRLDYPHGATVGVIGSDLTAEVAAALDVPGDLRRVGSQSACVQWSDACTGPGRRLAIGDAALAYSPLAGQGVRFALSSAIAAAAVISSWRDGEDGTGYYRSFVAGARRRHLAKLAGLDETPPDHEPLDLDRRLAFLGTVRSTEMNVGGRITTGDAVVLDDGGLVRGVGGFDLLLLRDALGEGPTGSATCGTLVEAGLAEPVALGLLEWGMSVGLVGYSD